MARRAWVSCGEGAAGGPFSTNTALRGCELLYQNDVTNATLKPLRSGSPFDQTPCRAAYRSGRQHGRTGCYRCRKQGDLRSDSGLCVGALSTQGVQSLYRTGEAETRHY